MMILRSSLVLISGLMLGSCCLSGNCYAPVAGPVPTAAPADVAMTAAPDGLGPDPMDEADAPAKPRKSAQRRRDTVGESEASAASRYRGDSYEQQQAADRADEARLKRKLIICQNCSPSGN
jgi:hypothetical protein